MSVQMRNHSYLQDDIANPSTATESLSGAQLPETRQPAQFQHDGWKQGGQNWPW